MSWTLLWSVTAAVRCFLIYLWPITWGALGDTIELVICCLLEAFIFVLKCWFLSNVASYQPAACCVLFSNENEKIVSSLDFLSDEALSTSFVAPAVFPSIINDSSTVTACLSWVTFETIAFVFFWGSLNKLENLLSTPRLRAFTNLIGGAVFFPLSVICPGLQRGGLYLTGLVD